MSHVKKLLAAAALALPALAAPQAANADFTVHLDNYATGDALNWSQTNNTISVCVHYKVLGVLSPFCEPIGARVLDTRGGHNFLYTGGWNASDVGKITVTTNGSNAFWLDQIKLLNANLSTYFTDGVDNTFGWCFSTAAETPAPSNCQDNVFARGWTTTVPGGVNTPIY